jgi:23S rRNA (guanosine2251-2'-O)-methyltransferase
MRKSEADSNIIFGRHPVLEALQSEQEIERVVLLQGTRGEFEKEIRHACRNRDIPLIVSPKERLDRLVRGNHQGVIAFAALIHFQSVDDVLAAAFESGETPLLLMLDGITDVRNFGAIARSAECSGVHGIILPAKGSAQINAEAIKTSAGALLNIPVCRVNSLVSTLERLQDSGIQAFAGDLQAKHPLFELDLTTPTLLIAGAEGEGVQRALLHRVNKRFIIPQAGTTNSFNVSVAIGIMLYETMRQRKTGL